VKSTKLLKRIFLPQHYGLGSLLSLRDGTSQQEILKAALDGGEAARSLSNPLIICTEPQKILGTFMSAKWYFETLNGDAGQDAVGLDYRMFALGTRTIGWRASSLEKLPSISSCSSIKLTH
jgi:hypothetical protein